MWQVFIVSNLYVISHLILMITLCIEYSYVIHFTYEEAEAEILINLSQFTSKACF